MQEKKDRAALYVDPTLAYKKAASEVLDDSSVDSKSGLNEREVRKRQEYYGKNQLPTKQGTTPFLLFVKQFKDLLILILFVAAGISYYAGQMANVYIILAVIVFNALMGFVQEFKAEKAVESIKRLVKHRANVIRDGHEQSIPAKDLVPGDILSLQEGQTILGDARLIQARGLRTVEASLTGESTPAEKTTDPFKKDMPLADRSNMVWKGTHVVRGTGKAVVVSTGSRTEIGKIASSLGEMEKEPSNFRRKTARLARKMATIAVSTSVVVFLLGYFYRSFAFEDILLVTIATMVSSIPEGLPVVISIVLAIGAGRMAKRNAIIREFTATEVLGSVSTILSDKTGTITQSVLTVQRLLDPGLQEYEVEGGGYELQGAIQKAGKKASSYESLERNAMLRKILTVAAYCNKARLEIDRLQGKENGRIVKDVHGDPTELALEILGKKSGIREDPDGEEVEVLDDLPFNSEQKFRATLIENNGTKELLVVGAPEVIVEKSLRIFGDVEEPELDEGFVEKVNAKADEWADGALRVIALARKVMPGTQTEIGMEDIDALSWVGLVGIIDPPREGVQESIATCRKAGIRVVMVTGDHERTAASIARDVGIIDGEARETDAYPQAVSEREVKDLRDEKFDEYIQHVSVFARVSPNTKLRIADRLQAHDELVAMTGDGVNDAPALKKADVGIAMGQRGTDVAKDAAKIVLSDDNFSSIVAAVHEGRIVFENVKATSYFLLTTNFASTTTLITALVAGLSIPVTAVQILWINMVTDGIMDVAKATEPGHGGMMSRNPIKKKEPILRWEVLPYLMIMAVVMVSLALVTFQYYRPLGLGEARTGAFFAIAMTQVFNLFNMRDLRRSVFKIGFFSNKWVNLAFAGSIVLQLLVVKVPALQTLFGFGDIPFIDFLVITVLSTIVLWVGELYKALSAKGIARH